LRASAERLALDFRRTASGVCVALSTAWLWCLFLPTPSRPSALPLFPLAFPAPIRSFQTLDNATVPGCREAIGCKAERGFGEQSSARKNPAISMGARGWELLARLSWEGLQPATGDGRTAPGEGATSGRSGIFSASVGGRGCRGCIRRATVMGNQHVGAKKQ
jgi:hypothetical protein